MPIFTVKQLNTRLNHVLSITILRFFKHLVIKKYAKRGFYMH